MKALVLTGRILFSLIFLTAAMSHFTDTGINYAASQGIPLTAVLVPLSGIIASLSALSIMFGYKAKAGAWLIIIFLIPVTFLMHKFWVVSDPMMMQMQMSMFMKNLSIVGGALIITYFGAGSLGFDAKAQNSLSTETNNSEPINSNFIRGHKGQFFSNDHSL